MKYNPEIHHRRSIRLRGYDYSQAGAYFVTICTQNRECLFGDMMDGEMLLNDAGNIVHQCWDDIPNHFPHVDLDEFGVMPNHVHGIIMIVDSPSVGAKNFSPLPGTSKTIGSIVRGFKIGVTKWMRNNTLIHDVWQRNYWEHIVRDESELNRIREYIRNNPVQWELDRLHPGRGEKFFAPTRIRESSALYGCDATSPDDKAWMV
jgi:putative transposase